MASTIQIKRGTGSAVPSGLSDGELAINLDSGQLYFGSGSTSINSFRFTNLTADNYIVSSSVTNITTQTLSGSTEFGDDSTDIHNRTGSLNISGTLNLDGNIVGDGATDISGIDKITTTGRISSSFAINASEFIANGRTSVSYSTSSLQGTLFSGIPAGGSILIGKGNQTFPVKIPGSITASNDISASGTIIGSNLSGTNTGDQNISNLAVTGSSVLFNDITASGDISSSGTIFTETIKSPTSNLVVSSSTVTITAGTVGDANLILQADTDNNNEADNPFMLFEQDGGAIRSIIGHTGADDEWPDATTLTGGISNNLVIGTTGSAGAARGMQFATLNTARMTISSSGEIGIGTNDPNKELEVIGDISSSQYNYAARYYTNDQLALNNVNGAITLGYDNTYPINIGKSTNPIALYGDVSASGNISASGDLTLGGTVYLDSGDSVFFGAGTSNEVRLRGSSGTFYLISGSNTGIEINPGQGHIQLDGNITASGNISSSGAIQAAQYAVGGKGFAIIHSDTLRHGYDSSLVKYSYGKDSDNEHFFYGDITASANISSSGTITADKVVSDNIQAGWHGSTTRIKILVSDFIPDDIGRPAMIDDTGSDRWLESHGTGKLFASIPIPTGFKATHVHIYGSATSAITVYEADINSKTVTSKGTGNIGTEIDITDVTSDTTNYLFLELDQASGEEVYGGYVTIEAV